jgi:hypothetical protein
MRRLQRNRIGWRAAGAVAALAAMAAWGARGGAALADEPGTKLPPGVVACAFDALANDPDPAGANIRQAPSASAPVLGALPQVESAEAEMGKIPPVFHVIGTKDGWFLIEGAHYDKGYNPPKNAPKIYAGRGWVAGNLITTGLKSATLKQAPRDDAPDVVALSGDFGGGSFDPTGIPVRRFLGCSGEWFEVEVPLSTSNYKLEPKLPSDGPKGTVRGWTRGYCTALLTTCV